MAKRKNTPVATDRGFELISQTTVHALECGVIVHPANRTASLCVITSAPLTVAAARTVIDQISAVCEQVSAIAVTTMAMCDLVTVTFADDGAHRKKGWSSADVVGDATLYADQVLQCVDMVDGASRLVPRDELDDNAANWLGAAGHDATSKQVFAADFPSTSFEIIIDEEATYEAVIEAVDELGIPGRSTLCARPATQPGGSPRFSGLITMTGNTPADVENEVELLFTALDPVHRLRVRRMWNRQPVGRQITSGLGFYGWDDTKGVRNAG